MVRVDVFSSVGAFTHQITRYPRIVVPSLWSTDHLRAFCVDKALDFAHLVPHDGENYRPTPGVYSDDDEACWEDSIDPDVVEQRKRKNIISSFGGSTDSEGQRMLYVQEDTPRRFAEQILDEVVVWMQEGIGRDLFPQNTICAPNWYLDHVAASMSEDAVNIPFTCLAWKVDLPIADVLSMVRTDECEAVQHIVAIVSPHIISASRARTLGITARDRRKDYHSIKRLRESVRLEDESRRGKIPSNVETVDPMHVAILLGMCQKQWELDSGKRKYYSAHIFTYLVNETDEDKPALKFITITGRFSSSYFINLNKLKPQRPSRTAATSAPTIPTDSQNARVRSGGPLPDEMEIKVRTVDLLPASSETGDVEPVIRNLYFLLGHLGGLIKDTARDMEIPETRPDDATRNIDINALEEFFASSTSTASSTTLKTETTSTTTTTFVSTTITETASISSEGPPNTPISSASSGNTVVKPLPPLPPCSPNSSTRKRRSPSEETDPEPSGSPPKRAKKAPKPLLHPSTKPAGPRPPPPSKSSKSSTSYTTAPSTPSKQRRALGSIDANKVNIRSPLQRVKEDLLAKPNLKTATPMMTPRRSKRGHDEDDFLGENSPSPTQKRRIAASA